MGTNCQVCFASYALFVAIALSSLSLSLSLIPLIFYFGISKEELSYMNFIQSSLPFLRLFLLPMLPFSRYTYLWQVGQFFILNTI